MSSIFISYRRGISSGWAGRLAEKLGAHFGSGNIFMDIETLQPGTDFVEAISNAVRSCDVLLAIIAPDWVNAMSESGRRRLDDPHDFVRIEISSALSKGVRVIPVLVGRATMPTADDLPEDLQPLARRQAHEISDTRWDFDCQKLIKVLERIPGIEVTGADPMGRRPAWLYNWLYRRVSWKAWIWVALWVIFLGWLSCEFGDQARSTTDRSSSGKKVYERRR